MAKHTEKIDALKAWRKTLKTPIVEKKHDDATDKGITKTYARAKNTH